MEDYFIKKAVKKLNDAGKANRDMLEVMTLMIELGHYAQHLPNCRSLSDNHSCSCGFDSLLSDLKAELKKDAK